MSIDRPAGWYADGASYGQQERWWDGNQWTAQVRTPYQGGPGVVLRAPEGTSPYTGHIWAILAIYTATIIAGVVYPLTVDWGGYMQATLNDPTGLSMYGYIFNVPYLLYLVLSFFGWAGTIVLAYFDGKALAARGVARPFPWALSFIPTYGALVYVIGRSVVAHRRTGSGLAPMWIVIILTVLGFILGIVAAVLMMTSMMTGFASEYSF